MKHLYEQYFCVENLYVYLPVYLCNFMMGWGAGKGVINANVDLLYQMNSELWIFSILYTLIVWILDAFLDANW